MTQHKAARLSLAIQLGTGVDSLPASRAQIRRWVAAAIEGDARLTVRFTGTAEGRRLNREYRGQDHATNVLTFAYDDGAHGGNARPTEADIVICLPVLQREAQRRSMPPRDHLAHLLIHGVLHAFGHDHETDEQARPMQAREIEVLARFRIADPYRR
jgi:probable rRNA maturation factor